MNEHKPGHDVMLIDHTVNDIRPGMPPTGETP